MIEVFHAPVLAALLGRAVHAGAFDDLRPFVKLWIAENFGKGEAGAVYFLNMRRKFAQAMAHAAGREVGLAAGFENGGR